MTVTLRFSAGATSSLDAPVLPKVSWADDGASEPTSTLGGLYSAPMAPQPQDDEELRSWARLARRAFKHWAKENPY